MREIKFDKINLSFYICNMKLIKNLGLKKSTDDRFYVFGIFECDFCKNHVEKIKRDGLSAKYCSHSCYAKNRKKRGSYKPDKKIIITKYIYVYAPEHPNAIGTKKLYVAEHRLIMEEKLGRYLTNEEIVHHKDENTMNNEISNLQLMTPSEHSRHHSKNRKKLTDLITLN